MTDPFDGPEWNEWAQRAIDDLVPSMRASSVVVSLVPEVARKTDIKFAVELGMAIMLDKPIVAVVAPGMKVPEHLVRVADRIVAIDFRNGDQDAFQRQLMAAIEDMNLLEPGTDSDG